MLFLIQYLCKDMKKIDAVRVCCDLMDRLLVAPILRTKRERMQHGGRQTILKKYNDMNTSSVKLYSLNYAQARTYAAAALFVLGNIALPQLCHLIPAGGRIFLPIYFFTLLGACKYGWRVGLLTALLSPLLNSALFGMPALAVLPVIMFKSVALAIAGGVTVAHFRKVSLPIMAGIVLSAQIAGSAFEWMYTGSFAAAASDFTTGLAGIVLQIFGCWAIIRYVIRK